MESFLLVVAAVIVLAAGVYVVEKLGNRLDDLSALIREHDRWERDAVRGKFADEPLE